MGHTVGERITDKASTCESIGYRRKACKTCKTVLETEQIDALEHQYQSVVTASTGTEMGYTTKICEQQQHTGDQAQAESGSAVTVPGISAGGVAASAVALLWFFIKKKKHV